MPIPQLKPLKFNRKTLTDEELINFYHALVLPRLIEEKMFNHWGTFDRLEDLSLRKVA